MKEIWKPVKNYEGWYEVSNLGRVRSVDRIVTYSDGIKHLWKGQMMKLKKGNNGYLQIGLSKNSKVNFFIVHRLVAQAFIQNPDNLPQVNHKDENKTNNCVSNLEFCSHSYNVNYGTRNKRVAEKRLNSPKFSKYVLQIDLETNQIIAEYPSTMEAERQLKINRGGISNCCLRKRKTYKGFKWKYKKE